MKSYPNLSATLLAVIVLFGAQASFAQITGHLAVCRGASRTVLTGTPSGGTWSSGDVTRATVNTTTGEVTGVNTGTATISYTDPTSAVHTAVVTVNTYVMSAIGFSMGTDIRCTGGATATCTVSPVIGNNWTTSDGSIATISAGGLVTPGSTAGTVIISYRHGYGNCYVTRNMTVNPTPTVSVTNPVCAGITQTATGTPSGGTWMSTNTSVGTINSTTGVLSTLISGSTGIRYTVGGCLSQPLVTVVAAPAAITGATTLCVGSSAALASTTSGGTWSSADPSIATIGSSTGLVTGIGAGATTISYIVGSGCFRTVVVTVNAAPSASVGPDEVCAGQTITLTNATGGGSWSSSNTSRATVTTYGGVVTGVTAGTVNISYRIGAGCAAVKTVTVNGAMSSIVGGPDVCEGSSVSLSHSLSGGTWSASNANATVNTTSGLMTGVTAGAVNITYTVSPGCVKVQMMTVKSTPAAITGVLTVCPGTTATLSSASGGGTWSSSNTSVATVVSSSGVVTGVSGGTAIITYTVASWGCSTTAVVTVSSAGGTISGSATLFPGLTSTLTAWAGGGTWSSSNTSVATVGSSTGIVSAIAAGTATITYSLGSCTPATIVVTVLSTPAPITGGLGLEVGDGDTLANPVSGGLWSSSNTSVATVGSTSGILTAVSIGTSTISYTVGSVYTATIIVTVSSTIAPSGCGRSWVPLARNVELTPRRDASCIDMGLDECGVPYVGLGYYSTSSWAPFQNHLRVLKFVDGRFEQLGPIMDSTSTEHISVAAAPDGTAYVAYLDYTDAFNLVVKKYDGSGWVTVGGSPLTTGGATLGSIRIDDAGVPYLGYGDWADGGQLTVKKFNGTTWEPVGTAGFAPAGAGITGMELDDSGHVYVSYEAAATEAFMSRMEVMKYNGSTWVELGDSVTTFAPAGWESHLAVSGDGTPFVSWFDGWGTSVSRFNGTTWENIGMPVLGPYCDIFPGNGGEIMLSYNDYFGTRTIRYDGSNWLPFGSSMSDVGADSRIKAAMSPSGEQYTALLPYIGNRALMLRLDGSQAQYVPSNQGIATPTYSVWYSLVPPHVELAFDAAGTKYIAYAEGDRAAIRKFSDGYWVPLDSDDPAASAIITGDITGGYFDMANDSAGNIYIAIPTSTPTAGVIVKKYNGTSWSTVGSVIADALTGVEATIDLKVSSAGFPYVTFGYGSDLIKVWRFDGTTWNGSSIDAQVVQLSMDIDASGAPYVFYTEWLTGRVGFVKKYDGSSWVTLGGGSCTAGLSDYTDIAIAPDGTPHIIYTDGVNGNKATVAKFVSGSWTAVGGGVVSPGASASTSIVFSSTGVPFISFIDSTNNEKVVVKEFDGSSWLEIGGATISSEDFTSARVVLDDDDVPYVSGNHSMTFLEPVVMKYASGNEVTGNLTVCAGQTTTLHAFGSGSWTSSNPSVAAVSCIGLVRGIAAGTAAITYTNDTCETVLVVTVNASPSAGTITGASVVPYGGSITLSASVSGGVWSSSPGSVATVSSSGVVSGVSDGNGVIRYTVTSGGCSAYASHAVTVVWMKPASTSVTAVGERMTFSVYPNPTSGTFNLQSVVAGTVKVVTIDGRVVLESKVEEGSTAMSMPVGISHGVYMVRFTGTDGAVHTTKLIYQP